MCGRFTLTVSSQELAAQFKANPPQLPQLEFNWNISPTTPIYFVKGQNPSGQERAIDIAKWGMVPSWAKAASRASNAINARSESIAEKPTFREAFRTRRCIIPATGYYEWATELGPYPPKQPFYIQRKDRALLAIAGIYEYWIDPVNKKEVTTASIITREALGGLATIHHRMPVFLSEDKWSQWVGTSHLRENEIDRYLKLLDSPELDSEIEFHPVGSAVNSALKSGAQLIEPITLGEPETLF